MTIVQQCRVEIHLMESFGRKKKNESICIAHPNWKLVIKLHWRKVHKMYCPELHWTDPNHVEIVNIENGIHAWIQLHQPEEDIPKI